MLTMLPTNYLSVFDHFVGLALKGLNLKLHPFAPRNDVITINHSLKKGKAPSLP